MPDQVVRPISRGDQCALQRLSHFSSLPNETRDALEDICRVRSYSAGQTLIDADEDAPYIGCVVQGFLRMQKTLHDGRQQIVGLLVEGDIFGLMLNGPMSVAIEAATDAEICTFHRPAFEALLQRSTHLEQTIMLSVLNELDRARDWMMILGSTRVRGRVAGFLLVLCTRFAKVDHLVTLRDDTLSLKIPIGRTDLAHLLGARVESISRAFHALADKGCIAIKKPDLIEVIDLNALAMEAGEEDAAKFASVIELIGSVRRRGR